MTEEKRNRLLAAASVTTVLLIVIMSAIVVYQLVIIGRGESLKKQIKSDISRYEQLYEEKQDEFERLQSDWFLRQKLLEYGYHK